MTAVGGMATALRPPLLALCLILAACSGGETDGPPRATDPPVAVELFGINAQNLRPLATRRRRAELERQLGSISRIGVDFVRASLDWRVLEPRPRRGDGRSYEWDQTDRWVAGLARHQLRWQVTGKGAPTPLWAVDADAHAAGCGSGAPPARASDFARLMGAIAERYGREGKLWRERPRLPYRPVIAYEIWNEPNFGRFWCPTPDPVAYARLYAAARDAIKAADPKAQVMLGGLAGFVRSRGPGSFRMAADEFLRRAVESMPSLRENVDAVGVHPYGSSPADVLGRLAWFRRALDSADFDVVPMSVNEFGWVTGGSGPIRTTEERRAAFVDALLPAIVHSECRIAAVALHTWVTPEADPLDSEDWYGVADPLTAEPYPTALTYSRGVAALVAGVRGGPPRGIELPAHPVCADELVSDVRR